MTEVKQAAAFHIDRAIAANHVVLNEHSIQNKVTALFNNDDRVIPCTARNAARAADDQGLSIGHGDLSAGLRVFRQTNIPNVIGT